MVTALHILFIVCLMVTTHGFNVLWANRANKITHNHLWKRKEYRDSVMIVTLEKMYGKDTLNITVK